MGKVVFPGILCMPLKKNLKGVPSNWREVKCPKCGQACYERPIPKGYTCLDLKGQLCTGVCLKEGKKQVRM